MSNLESKSDFSVGLNHMANVLGPSIILGLIIGLFYGLVILPNIDPRAILPDIIKNITILSAILFFIYRSGKYVNSKYSYLEETKVILFSMLSFFIINTIFVLATSYFNYAQNIAYTALKMSYFDAILKSFSWEVIVFYLVFYGLYFFIGMKGLDSYD